MKFLTDVNAAWIEICSHLLEVNAHKRRPPHGGRGLKSRCHMKLVLLACRPPHGGRGLKSQASFYGRGELDGRPPHGGRGLKYRYLFACHEKVSSPSPRRAWIEITALTVRHGRRASPSPRRAWIEMSILNISLCVNSSPSPRRAWIEIKVEYF